MANGLLDGFSGLLERPGFRTSPELFDPSRAAANQAATDAARARAKADAEQAKTTASRLAAESQAFVDNARGEQSGDQSGGDGQETASPAPPQGPNSSLALSAKTALGILGPIGPVLAGLTLLGKQALEDLGFSDAESGVGGGSASGPDPGESDPEGPASGGKGSSADAPGNAGADAGGGGSGPGAGGTGQAAGDGSGSSADGPGNAGPDDDGPGGEGGAGGGGGSGGGACCFTAGTMVRMDDGKLMRIEHIRIGDRVRGQSGINEVIGIDTPLLEDRPLISFNDSDPFTTWDHPFWDGEVWRCVKPASRVATSDLHVEELNVGNRIVVEDGDIEVTQIRNTAADPETQLYDLNLDGDHTYFANGYLAHNCLAGGKVGRETQGPDPDGPGGETGTIPIQTGEFVIRKSAVEKYGPEALRRINEGKVDPRALMRALNQRKGKRHA